VVLVLVRAETEAGGDHHGPWSTAGVNKSMKAGHQVVESRLARSKVSVFVFFKFPHRTYVFLCLVLFSQLALSHYSHAADSVVLWFAQFSFTRQPTFINLLSSERARSLDKHGVSE